MKKLKIIACLLALILFLECFYCVAVFTDWVPVLSDLRRTYIETALNTLNHRWLATALIPGDVVQTVVDDMDAAKIAQSGQNSSWQGVDETAPRGDFFDIFYELDRESVLAWVEEHPETVENGWDKFCVNRAGLNDEGTSMRTTLGDQVLAVDAENGLLVIRITGERYRGVLVIGKDASRLACAAAEDWGRSGQTVGQIAEGNQALAALTASGFSDTDGSAEGASQTGAAMCGGVALGDHLPRGYKRIELRSDDRLYIVDADSEFDESCTDASEWTPALIVDGQVVVSAADHYTAMNPRACLGQKRDGAVLMLCIEGRYLDSLGCDAVECASVLARYGAYQAMNLDGGTSAICWYQGEVITRCADPDRPQGRELPNAWIYRAGS